MTPSKNAAVVCVRATKCQKRSVAKFSMTAMEPPRASMALTMPMPPT